MSGAMSEEEKRDWLRLARTPRVGPIAFSQLLARFGSASEALKALPDLAASRGRKFIPPSEAEVEKEWHIAETRGIGFICANEPGFPKLLKQLQPPPPILSYIGNLELAGRPCIAMVGARNASAAGRKLAHTLAAELGTAGHVIVSGMARGIDGQAHAAALSTGSIAVLAGGVDQIYPPQHEALYKELAEQGLILSERPIGTKAIARDFPRRNRIVTGLSAGLVVVEAAEKSGSLISARFAAEQNRDVMACPGSPLDPLSAGTNQLIRDGATLVRSAEDVLEALGAGGPLNLFEAQTPLFEGLSAAPSTEAEIDQVRAVLSHTPVGLDDITRSAALTAPQCAAILAELELLGEIETLPGGLAVKSAAVIL